MLRDNTVSAADLSGLVWSFNSWGMKTDILTSTDLIQMRNLRVSLTRKTHSISQSNTTRYLDSQERWTTPPLRNNIPPKQSDCTLSSAGWMWRHSNMWGELGLECRTIWQYGQVIDLSFVMNYFSWLVGLWAVVPGDMLPGNQVLFRKVTVETLVRWKAPFGGG